MNRANFYDWDADVVNYNHAAKLDFSTTDLPPRCITRNDYTTMLEVAEVPRPSTPPGCKSLIEFEKRNGRDDNLMYRQTEEARISIQNETDL